MSKISSSRQKQSPKRSSTRLLLLVILITALVAGAMGHFFGVHEETDIKLAPLENTLSDMESHISYTLPDGWSKEYLAHEPGSDAVGVLRLASTRKLFSDTASPATTSGVTINIAWFNNDKTKDSPIDTLARQVQKRTKEPITRTTIDGLPALHYFADASHNVEFYLIVQGDDPSYTWNVIPVYTGKDQADINAQKSKYQEQVNQFVKSLHFN